MIDLHTHTDQSDGSLTPEQLVDEAVRAKLEALAITDHDTFTGYDRAAPHARDQGLELLCGIELSTDYHGRSVHLLAYFLRNPPPEEFRQWVVSLQVGRRKRNQELVAKLCSEGMPITLEEVAAQGRNLIARPHFAAVMLQKGYVASLQEAFDRYLAESGSCFVPRDEPSFLEAVGRIRSAGGLPILPHPGRLKVPRETLEKIVEDMCKLGLAGIEAYHSDHSPEQTSSYESLARRLGVLVSGGSDFHGAAKPRIALGSGINRALNIPYQVLTAMRRVA